MEWKYFKPLSLTWWALFCPFVLGMILATEPLHHLKALSDSVRLMTNGMSPYLLINVGLGGIGYVDRVSRSRA